jgi:hypothetical protein
MISEGSPIVLHSFWMSIIINLQLILKSLSLTCTPGTKGSARKTTINLLAKINFQSGSRIKAMRKPD